MSEQPDSIGYTRSSLLPQEQCNCQNCVLNDPTSNVCSSSYRRQHCTDHPCPL